MKAIVSDEEHNHTKGSIFPSDQGGWAQDYTKARAVNPMNEKREA